MYKVFVTNGLERLEMPDGGSRIIQIDADGNKFAYIDNPYTLHPLRLFNNKIYDAIKAVREDYGDAIDNGGEVGGVHVSYFINRVIGKAKRSKTIEGFKNVTEERIKYAIYLPFGTNPSDGRIFYNKNKKKFEFSFNIPSTHYDTEKEAEEYLVIINSRAELIEMASIMQLIV